MTAAVSHGKVHITLWTRDKARPLAEHLIGRGDLDAEQRYGVEAMAALHLKKHGGDVEKILAALPGEVIESEA